MGRGETGDRRIMRRIWYVYGTIRGYGVMTASLNVIGGTRKLVFVLDVSPETGFGSKPAISCVGFRRSSDSIEVDSERGTLNEIFR